jgi:hypothetical protein
MAASGGLQGAKQPEMFVCADGSKVWDQVNCGAGTTIKEAKLLSPQPSKIGPMSMPLRVGFLQLGAPEDGAVENRPGKVATCAEGTQRVDGINCPGGNVVSSSRKVTYGTKAKKFQCKDGTWVMDQVNCAPGSTIDSAHIIGELPTSPTDKARFARAPVGGPELVTYAMKTPARQFRPNLHVIDATPKNK